MADVFISYTRDDRERIAELAHALEDRGIDVWWDPELVPGDQYATRIKTVLAEAKAVIVGWSKASVERGWVLDEAAVGRDRGVLLPVILEPGVSAPLGFGQVAAEDLSKWPGPDGEAAFERLVEAIGRLRGAPARAGQVTSPQARAMRRVAIGAAGVVLVALSAFAVSRVVQGPSDTPPGQEGVDGPPDERSTDAPGAGEMYGLEPDEVAAYGAHELIQLALQRTTIEVIEQDARGGDPFGQALMCLALAFGEGLPADAAAARTQCEAASQAGEHVATFQLAEMTRASDAAAADALMLRAAQGGDPRAQAALARTRLASGARAEALDYARRSADQGNLGGQVLLGDMYLRGDGAPQDAREAMRWYQQAAEGGSAAGLRAVGVLYETGQGVGQDYARARMQYEIAAELGDGEAARRYGVLLQNGQGGDADPERARAMYLRAADLGDEEARAALAQLE